ncbi:phthiocerol/phenolphthiocerol synthesis type-I polyketide synthase E [Kitasatospora sp. GAS204A]|uniref:type I polyketide synthase n=1 Tax=unclassified Kitasatospora TaxID=2633591 RepID=UPI0024732128|nr:type I polyketide synthase [Kitasatospora sp. GAS204B]MDH6118950.1 phthiocerol/phenolphthiocerol synthesis type-I polyketide synthase E [Kitasatospora sp. GAS204B]
MRVMDATSNGIAVVGMQCRVPGAEDVEQFWENLLGGRESISTLSAQELEAAGVPAEKVARPEYVARGGFLRGVGEFDAEYFGFSPREAELLDPQQRLLLEVATEALQRSGHDPQRFPGLIGIYAGVGFPGYLMNNVMSHPEVLAEFPMLQVVMSGDKDYASSRVAYKLDLRGPAVTVQSACSTSLVAVHLAVQALLNGDTDLALAGGASIYPSGHGYEVAEGGLLSPDGHCRPFDAKSSGTVPGSGAGVVVLRRLEDALADGDTIHAVITGTAVNNDGAVKVGYTAPSKTAQARVIAEALAIADAAPATIGYVEAHGAATSLGDPIEVAALSEAFGASPALAPASCALGSVKSNIGHLDAAAGVTGLIKAILTVEHGVIPPTLHYTEPNPHLDLDRTPFHVPTSVTPWPATRLPRRAGASSFGMGGTNAHVILEQAPERGATPPATRRPHVLPLSAKTPQALDQATARLAEHLGRNAGLALPDIAHTLQYGRTQHPYRRVVIADSTEQATALLHQADPAAVFSDRVAERRSPVVLLFSGVGDHYPEMAAQLYEHEPVFRAEFRTCASILRPMLGTDLTEVFQEPGDGSHDAPDLSLTRLAQPFAFVLGYALAQLYRSYGVEPAAVGGYSIGEYTAACVAGVLALDEALSLVASRAALIDELPGGSMVAVLADTATLEPYLAALPDLCFAAIDGPMLTVVSGSSESVRSLAEQLTADGVASRTLPTSHAFHSPMMRPAADALRTLASRFELRPPAIPVLSNVTGGWLSEEEATDPDYFARHLTQPVRFADNLAEVWDLDEAPIIVEIGPGQILGSLAMQHPARAGAPRGLVLPGLPGRSSADDDLTTVRATLGRLWLRGADIRWGGDAGASEPAPVQRRVALPTYPFQRRSYWLKANAGVAPVATGRRKDPSDWFYLPSWRRVMPLEPGTGGETPFLVLAADAAMGTALADALRRRGADVQLAISRAGQQVERTADGVYRYDAMRPDSVVGLLDALAATLGGIAPRLVNALAATLPPAGHDGQQDDVVSLLYLAQALTAVGQVASVELSVVTAGAQSVSGELDPHPARAMLSGACRVLGQELPHVRPRTIDIVGVTGPDALPAVLGPLVSELLAAPADAAVALRGPHRWVQAFEPVRFREDTGRSVVRKGGTYLLIGGLGPLGRMVARQLVATTDVNLAFLQRTPMPAQADWQDWASGGDERLDYAVAALKELEGAGAQVMTVTADISSPEALAAAVAQVEDRFGPLTGVVHSAGMVNEGASVPMHLVDREACERHFAAKVRGLRVLADCLDGKPLDFVLVNSSIASVLGGIGYYPYAAANCHMDAFAQRESERTGVSWMSVNWEGWTFGDAAKDASTAATLAEYLIDDEAGRQVMARLFGNPFVPQVVVSTGPLDSRIAQWVTGAWRAEAGGSSDPAADQTLHDRPVLQTDYRECSDELELALREIWQQLLGVRQIGADDSFFALGGHSLIATRVVARISEELGVHVPLHELLTHPTLAGLAMVVREARDRVSDRRRSRPIIAVSRDKYRTSLRDPAAGEQP